MQEIVVELGVGDVIQVGDELFTIDDIEGGEVSIRIDPVEDFACVPETVPPGK